MSFVSVFWITLCMGASTVEASVTVQKTDCELFVSVNPRNAEELAWLKSREWRPGVEVSPKASEEEVRQLFSDGWKVYLQMMGHPESHARQFDGKQHPKVDTGEILRAHIRAAGGDASKVFWTLLLEEDSAGVAFPQQLLREKTRTHGDALALMRRRIKETMDVGRQFPGVHLYGRCGYASGAHYFAEGGVEAILVERSNDDVEDLQTGIAFARGAARQYGITWGVDFSQWWGPVYGCHVERCADYFRRNLYLSYFSGANVLAIELLGPLPKDENDDRALLSQALDEFGALKQHYEAGTPDVPVAIMLPHDHGWMTPPFWRTTREAWNYARIPYRQGDRGIDGLFGAIFPGSVYAMQSFPFGAYASDDPPASPFALSCVTPEFAPNPEDVYYAEPPLPFGRFSDRKAAQAALKEGAFNPSDYRPMGDSRWGDIVDVLTSEADAAALAKYPVLILAGHVSVTDTLRERLHAYVTAGGQLIWAVGTATPELAALTGLSIAPELQVGRAWRWKEEVESADYFLYTPAAPAGGASVEIISTEKGGRPLVTKHTLGQGAVYTVLVPWYEAGHHDLAQPALRLMDEIVGAVQPICIDGLPLEWISTRGAGQRTVVAANHGSTPWEGTVRLRALPAEFKTCRELRSGDFAAFERNDRETLLRVRIPAYDVCVWRWTL